ncbi:DUF5694 domain-containing protein [Flagellimonas meridianipacifica]|uniref:Uncharacterized protein n=1 Tax=Flagellimonas meridianipacifica TaxID=1080225 RepID=A0A2T0MFN9_9FLAO|nr:DUF5694 domain-containing protein [Allomuricauda pacifica]PRX56397.1 hypothetical protein CLV81_0394 [Allomuricauda pacifica]
MKKQISFLIVGIMVQLSFAQNTSIEKTKSDFFPKEKTKVLVVGMFHLDYPGLDNHKTKDDSKIDVLKEPKKTEVTELVEYIKKFKPTKIMIEAGTDWNKRYQEYRNGNYRDKRDERYQIALRVAHELDIDSVYSVDAETLQSELFEKDSVLAKSLIENIDWKAKDPYLDSAFKWYDYRDTQVKHKHILTYLKEMNSRESHNTNFGLYLTGQMATKDYDGADNFTIWWYNRNVRIFSNILRLTEGPQDRILAVFGNGHAAILRQLFEASPQYEFVEFDSLED